MYESVEYLIKALDTKVPGMKQGFNEREELKTVMEAMNVIKAFYSKHKGDDKCKKCPLGNQISGDCILKTWASNWNTKIVNKVVLTD